MCKHTHARVVCVPYRGSGDFIFSQIASVRMILVQQQYYIMSFVVMLIVMSSLTNHHTKF